MCVWFLFFSPRDEIRSFSRQASFRRINSTSTDFRYQVGIRTQTDTHTLLLTTIACKLEGSQVDTPVLLGWSRWQLRLMITGCCSFKQHWNVQRSHISLISNFWRFVIFLFVFRFTNFWRLSIFLQGEDSMLRIDSRMKNSQMSLVSVSLWWNISR